MYAEDLAQAHAGTVVASLVCVSPYELRLVDSVGRTLWCHLQDGCAGAMVAQSLWEWQPMTGLT